MKNSEKSLADAAMKSGMSENTARKYLQINRLPIEIAKQHDRRTREDPFADQWKGVNSLLELLPGLEAKTIFDYFQRESPGKVILNCCR